MNTQTSSRPATRPLELWPVESLAGTYPPAVVKARNPLAIRVESTADDGMARFASGFETFVARLTTELESLREGLAEVRTDIDTAQQAPSLRVRALDARLDEVTAQLQKLRGEVSRVPAGQAEVSGGRRFAVAVGTVVVLAAFSD